MVNEPTSDSMVFEVVPLRAFGRLAGAGSPF